MNQIEDYKREKDGPDVLADRPRYARAGWETITDGDKERLKWLGVFFRGQTPGSFMLRLRFTHGVSNAAQFRVIAALSRDAGVPDSGWRGNGGGEGGRAARHCRKGG